MPLPIIYYISVSYIMQDNKTKVILLAIFVLWVLDFKLNSIFDIISLVLWGVIALLIVANKRKV